MNEITIFQSEQFGQVRTVSREGEAWFVAADVCRALEHTNVSVALDRLDEDEKAKLNLGLSGGGTNIVNEPGLYSLVLGSRKPEAKAFKRWITHEVIPSIRKTGGYKVNDDEIPWYLLDGRRVAIQSDLLAAFRLNQRDIDNLIRNHAQIYKGMHEVLRGERMYRFKQENGIGARRTGSSMRVLYEELVEVVRGYRAERMRELPPTDTPNAQQLLEAYRSGMRDGVKLMMEMKEP